MTALTSSTGASSRRPQHVAASRSSLKDLEVEAGIWSLYRVLLRLFLRRSFFHDHVSLLGTSVGHIYILSRETECYKQYVGQTTQPLHIRMNHHVHNNRQPTGDCGGTAIRIIPLTTSLSLPSNKSILNYPPNKRKLNLILEVSSRDIPRAPGPCRL